MMGNKLGLAEAKKEDESLITDLLDWMHQNKADFTNTFRDLGRPELPDDEMPCSRHAHRDDGGRGDRSD